MINILMVCAFGALALSPSIAAMAALIFACGLPIAPMAACVYSLLGALAPRGMLTETFTWLNSPFPGGIVAGPTIAGVIVEEAGVRTALAAVAVGPALAIGLLAFLHGTLAGPRTDPERPPSHSPTPVDLPR